MGQQPIHQLLMQEGFADRRWGRGRIEQIGHQEHHHQATDQVIETQHRVDGSTAHQAALGVGHGLHQQVVEAIDAGIGPTAQDGRLLQGLAQRQGIKTGATDGMGHRQQGIGRKTDDHTRTHGVDDPDLGPGGRNEKTGGANGEGLSLNREGIDARQVGQNQLSLALLLHHSIDAGAPGTEQGEIAEAKET